MSGENTQNTSADDYGLGIGGCGDDLSQGSTHTDAEDGATGANDFGFSNRDDAVVCAGHYIGGGAHDWDGWAEVDSFLSNGIRFDQIDPVDAQHFLGVMSFRAGPQYTYKAFEARPRSRTHVGDYVSDLEKI
jgi:hypothetical protein